MIKAVADHQAVLLGHLAEKGLRLCYFPVYSREIQFLLHRIVALPPLSRCCARPDSPRLNGSRINAIMSSRGVLQMFLKYAHHKTSGEPPQSAWMLAQGQVGARPVFSKEIARQAASDAPLLPLHNQ